MITDVPGVRVGHWTDEIAQTGCTAVLLPTGSVTSGEVRGGAPGTRDFELLVPGRVVQHVDAVILTGGSAFGLAACDGAMRWCEEQGLGYETRSARVPIVVGMVIYDLSVGAATVRPGPDAGYAACADASAGEFATGGVGAATGAMMAKLAGPETARRGGLGTATVRDGELIVSALMVVNAMGDFRPAPTTKAAHSAPLEHTTIGVVVTNGTLSKTECFLMAQAGHAGMARAIEPVHTQADGDAIVASAGCEVASDLGRVLVMAAEAVELAIRAAAP